MVDICCVGHITSDKIVTPNNAVYMASGTAYYFSIALSNINTRYLLVTSLAEADMGYVTALRQQGIAVRVQPGSHTVYFENIYGASHDEREQNVLEKADPFTLDQLHDITARIFHLGPLLADDIPPALVKSLAAKGRLSLDVQGYLRKVVNKKVHATQWPQRQEVLQCIDIVKADVAELAALTGEQSVTGGVALLQSWGVKEVVITDGSRGSAVHAEDTCHHIPAYRPKHAVDATGCGDTYMVGYLYRRLKGDNMRQAGHFAAAMASLKMESPGPFKGTEEEVYRLLRGNEG